jgi:1,4-dihydroxy-6-naphthoate synthase
MELSLGFSSCPNDTFIFDALLHGKIDTEGLTFVPVIEDVESLNHKANQHLLDITKLSYHAYAYLTHQYKLLNAGSALGFGVGPLLISNSKFKIQNSELEGNSELRVGIPGRLTTANFLLSIAYPELKNKVEMVFSEIEGALLKGEIDLGLIIHENRFTYESKGLKKVRDLGEYWEELSGAAIPLGGIVVSRKFDEATQMKIDRVLRRSIEFAFANRRSSYDFVRAHSQEMSEEVMYKHIDLYVNQYSIDLGEEGIKAIHTLFNKAVEQDVIQNYESDFLVKKQ